MGCLSPWGTVGDGNEDGGGRERGLSSWALVLTLVLPGQGELIPELKVPQPWVPCAHLHSSLHGFF